MRNLEKSHKRDADDSSTINSLPDKIILQILNKLIDLKTLCFCYLVSRRFSSTVLQVGAISFTAPLFSPRFPDKNTAIDFDVRSSLCDDSFQPVTRFLSKFKGLKSLFIEFPSSSDRAIDNRCLFKWKVKFGHRIEAFIFLSPTSINSKDESYPNGNRFEEEDNGQLFGDMYKLNFCTSFKCLTDVLVWHMNMVKNLPMLEEVSITDSGRRGRLSLCGEKLSEVKECVNSVPETEMNRLKVPDALSVGFIPVLKLPVSGYMMKGIYCILMEMKDLQGGYDDLMNMEESFEDKEEAAYTEAVKEILEKHRGMLLSYLLE